MKKSTASGVAFTRWDADFRDGDDDETDHRVSSPTVRYRAGSDGNDRDDSRNATVPARLGVYWATT